MEITICMTVPGMRVEAMKDVTVLVTGASGGIGHLLAKRLRERGFLVIGWDMKPDPECDPLPVDVERVTTRKTMLAWLSRLVPKSVVVKV